MRTVCEQRSSSLGLSTELVTGSIPIFAMSLAIVIMGPSRPGATVTSSPHSTTFRDFQGERY
jgi:hypothetical protein